MAEANSEIEADTNLTNEAEKLLIYSIQKIYVNLSKLKCLPTEKRGIETIKADKLTNLYIYTLQQMLKPSLQYHGTNKVLNFFLLKLLFKDLRMLYTFCQYDFAPEEIVTRIPGDDPEEIKKHFEEIKISLLVYFKNLLKEFNLMKFYEQVADISVIKVNDKNFVKIYQHYSKRILPWHISFRLRL
jgi:hypothetical protein